MRLSADLLSPSQQIILACVQRQPAVFNRSELAKLLVGSPSVRVAAHSGDPDYGRLADHGRKAVTFEIDILLQQHYLSLDLAGKLLANLPPTSNGIE